MANAPENDRLIPAAVSGRPHTPPLFTMMEVLGRERTMRRIDQAIARLTDE